MRWTHVCITALCPAMLIVFPGTVSAQVTVSVNNEGSFTLHSVAVRPLESFRIDINVATTGEIFDVYDAKLLASAASVLTVTDGTFHVPWIGTPPGVPIGPLDPISPRFDVVLPYPDMFGPGQTTLATFEIGVNGSAPPGIYALNIVDALYTVCRICPAFSNAESGPDFVVYVLPPDCVDSGDSDGDGVPDCLDGCPDDPTKTDPGQCGCGVQETGDSDGDGILDCNDQCPGLDDSIFAPDCVGTAPANAIPTVSTWGMVVLSLLVLTAGTILASARRQTAKPASH